jgi:hypothetical protein
MVIMPKTLLTRRFDRGAERHLRSFFKLPDRRHGCHILLQRQSGHIFIALIGRGSTSGDQFLMAQGREFRHGVSELPLPLVESSFPHPKENTE